MIQPTPGRVVWFFPASTDPLHIPAGRTPTPPLAAHVARVWSDTCVNLMVIDGNGNTHSRTSVLLVQDDSQLVPPAAVPPVECSYCTWMPYQKGQAAKTEALERLASVVQPPAPEPAPPVEVKTYSDGTVAAGPAPLPESSPAEAVPAETSSAP